MDTKDFFDLVLPKDGYRCITTIHDGRVTQRYGADNEWASDLISQLDQDGVGGVFHACGGFNNREDGRVQTNVQALRSFWLDIDTQEGKPRETYADRREAITQLAAFSKFLGLPVPLLVDSGYGIHGYWPLTQDVDAGTWRNVALTLKRAAKKWGLAVDPSRTTDSASILRPVGSYNRKFGGARLVKVLRSCEPISLEQFTRALVSYAGAEPAPPSENINSDLMSREFAASDANEIASRCGAIAHVRDTGGDVPEPYWFTALSVLARTTQGAAICHEWSKGYSGYSFSETEAKISHALDGGGPATCESFSNYTDACATCPVRGKVKSPITLGEGRSIGEEVPIAELLMPGEDPSMFQHTVFPDGYGFGPMEGQKGSVLYSIKFTKLTVEGEPDVWKEDRHKLLNNLVIPVGRIVDGDNLYSMNVRMTDKHSCREFVLDNGLAAEGGSALYRYLGRHEVSVPSGQRAEFTNYLNAWIGQLRDYHDKTPSIEQYGWHGDNFVVGRDLVTPSNRGAAAVSGPGLTFTNQMVPRGTLKGWVDAVDVAYNFPGDEPLQFSVLASFAAPLWHMFGAIGGVTIFAYTNKSGFGKSTAQCAGLAAWGDSESLMLSQNNYTPAAFQTLLGGMRNLPVVVDELTNATPEVLSGLAYAVSAGKGKSRLNPDATMKRVYDWSTIAMSSGNARMSEKLALHRQNPEAEMMRIWEFTVPNKGRISVNDAIPIFAALKQNYGHAGRVYMDYVTKNRAKVEETLLATRLHINDRFHIKQEERYWSMLHAAALTALTICQKLGLLNFPREAMVTWIEQTMATNRSQVTDNSNSPMDVFSEMLGDLGEGVLVTIGEGNLRTAEGAAIIEKDPRGPLIGRHILDIPTLGGKPSASREELMLATSAIKQWCGKKGASFKEMHDALVVNGWAEPGTHKAVLGRGTFKYSGVTGQAACWKIRMSAIRAADGTNSTAQKILGIVNNSSGSPKHVIAAGSQ